MNTQPTSSTLAQLDSHHLCVNIVHFLHSEFKHHHSTTVKLLEMTHHHHQSTIMTIYQVKLGWLAATLAILLHLF